EIAIAPEVGGVRMVAGTGALWRIRRTAGPAGDRPPEPLAVPLYPIQYLALAGGALGAVAVLAWLARRRRGRRR
ncbi:MAG TPA: hypothetical protein VFL91_15770, partial [Thermomicrobiales bacterium]|nr:hypothetical protein [Thermomicrobiales bacterium]